ncbi:hypothetical protein IMSAGC013_00696 [Lachnospiraceae bacterium]|nr:hypothetical protein IMSAGC013_00696 [Lachnospiraceae bacterium]
MLFRHIPNCHARLHFIHCIRHCHKIAVIPFLLHILKGNRLRDLVFNVLIFFQECKLTIGLKSGKHSSAGTICIAFRIHLLPQRTEILQNRCTVLLCLNICGRIHTFGINIPQNILHILQSAFCYLEPGLGVRNISLIILVQLAQIASEAKGADCNNWVIRRADNLLLCCHLCIQRINIHFIIVHILHTVSADHAVGYSHHG